MDSLANWTSAQGSVLRQVDRQEMIDLAIALARLRTFTTEETSAALFLEDYLGSRGFETELQEVEAGRFQCIAYLRGKGGGRSLMLNGHTDIDPLTSGWSRDPWQPCIEGDRLYGHGLFNMKGGVAAMIAGALALRRSGVHLRGDIIVAAVVGELQAGVGTVHLIQSGTRPDAAIVTEPYGARNVITVHSGRWQAAITTLGRAVHHAVREQSLDAIASMTDIVRELNRLHLTGGEWSKVPGIPRLNVGTIIGGHGPDLDTAGAYYVSDRCTAIVDIRHGPGQTEESMTADLRRAIDHALLSHPGLSYVIEAPPPSHLRNSRYQFPVFDLPLVEPIVSVITHSLLAVTGAPADVVGVHIPGSRASDDTGHLWRAGIPCVLYGPAGNMDATLEIDGFVPISEMEICAKTIALSALQWCGDS